MIEIVSATRYAEAEFWKQSALGLSLRRFKDDYRLSARIAFENRRGLPEIYNSRIEAADSPGILVFMHDDVWIDDIYFVDRIFSGLKHFHVLGVAGNRRRLPGQPGWAMLDDKLTWDSPEFLSGRVGHGLQPFGEVRFFGACPEPCELLDGLFLAANKGALLQSGLRFDPQFDFHFYDIDFCRAARQRNLVLGTWQISLTHQSLGGFEGDAWREKRALYRQKWPD